MSIDKAKQSCENCYKLAQEVKGVTTPTVFEARKETRLALESVIAGCSDVLQRIPLRKGQTFLEDARQALEDCQTCKYASPIVAEMVNRAYSLADIYSKK